MAVLMGNMAGGTAGSRSGAWKVVALIPVIWVLNLLDLLFTLLAYQLGDFDELNPLARSIGWHWQIVLKLVCLTIFTAVCVAVRDRRITRLGCYAVTGVYAVLACLWLSMFNFLLSPYFFHMLRANF